ncbi:MAG TPA: hypothetical protein DCY16_06735 [Trichococcus sp.]|nr:hypothetical protein [Trichococcus sp.]
MNEDSTPSARQLVDGVLFLIFNGSGGRHLRPSRPWPEEKRISALYSGEVAVTGEKNKIRYLYSGEASLTGGKTGIQPGSSLWNPPPSILL